MLDNKDPADPPRKYKNRGERGSGREGERKEAAAVTDERRDKWRRKKRKEERNREGVRTVRKKRVRGREGTNTSEWMWRGR